jgi:hypothetical protein
MFGDVNAFRYTIKDDEFLIALELPHSDEICRPERTGHRISLFLEYQNTFSIVITEFI